MRFGIITTDDDPLWGGEEGVADYFIKRFSENKNEENDEFIPIFAVTGALPKHHEIDNYNGFLITGSHFSVNDDHEWQHRLSQFIRQVYYKGLKYGNIRMYGMCFGHQIIAKSLGGKVAQNPDEKFFFGSCPVYIKDEFLNKDYVKKHFEDKKRPFKMIKFHGECVTELPPVATIIGSSSQCQHEMLMYNDFILTSQGHPEYTKNTMKETNTAIMRRIGKLKSIDIKNYLTVIDEDHCDTLVEMVRSFLKYRSFQLDDINQSENSKTNNQNTKVMNQKSERKNFKLLQRQKSLSVSIDDPFSM